MIPVEPTGSNVPDPLLTYAEAAEYLKVPESSVRWWVARKEIPYRKAGRHTRFDRNDLDEWSRNRGAAATEGAA